VRFDERSLATLTSSIGSFQDSLAATLCWSAVADMVQQGELAIPAFVRMVAGGMGGVPSVSLLQTLHQTALSVLEQMADPAYVRAGKELLAAEAVRLLREAEPGSDHQLAWAQLLAATAVTASQLDLVAGLLEGSEQIAGLAVDTELRWRLLKRLATTGRSGDAEISAEAARDDTDAGKRHAAACRAAIPDGQHKADAWQQLAASAELSFEGAAEIARAFNQAEHAALLAPYADAYFDRLPDIWSAHSELVRTLFGGTLFPYCAASGKLLDQIDEYLARPGLPAGIARVVLEGRDVVVKALRSRELPA
jgi:aminopeptidase N